MPRSPCNGTISVGLINVPVKRYSATESKTVRFRAVHLEDGAKIEHRRSCSAEDREVPWSPLDDEGGAGHDAQRPLSGRRRRARRGTMAACPSSSAGATLDGLQRAS